MKISTQVEYRFSTDDKYVIRSGYDVRVSIDKSDMKNFTQLKSIGRLYKSNVINAEKSNGENRNFSKTSHVVEPHISFFSDYCWNAIRHRQRRIDNHSYQEHA